VERGQGVYEQAGTPLLNTDDDGGGGGDDGYDDDDDDDDNPKGVKELHGTDKRMTFVSYHKRRGGIFRLQ